MKGSGKQLYLLREKFYKMIVSFFLLGQKEEAGIKIPTVSFKN